MFKLGFASLALMIGAFAVAAPGCDSAEDAYDCHQICNRYEDCFDDGYDVDACESKCEDRADTDGYTEQASDCESCLDDKSCTESFACAAECAGIVP